MKDTLENDIKAQIKEAETKQEQIRVAAKSFMPPEAVKAADEAKANGAEVYASQVCGGWFVYRALNRFEYQTLMVDLGKQQAQIAQEAESEAALNFLMGTKEQNTVVMKALVYPKLDQMSIKTTPAGAIETLYAKIKEVSGFGVEAIVIKL